MEGGGRSHVSDQYAKIKKGSWFNQFCNGSNPWMARYTYGLMFLVANLLAWAVRDYGSSILKEMKSKHALNSFLFRGLLRKNVVLMQFVWLQG